MAAWGANHGAVSYGHIGADLVSLASMLRIPVCLHNLGEPLFRRWTRLVGEPHWLEDPRFADDHDPAARHLGCQRCRRRFRG